LIFDLSLKFSYVNVRLDRLNFGFSIAELFDCHLLAIDVFVDKNARFFGENTQESILQIFVYVFFVAVSCRAELALSTLKVLDFPCLSVLLDFFFVGNLERVAHNRYSLKVCGRLLRMQICLTHSVKFYN